MEWADLTEEHTSGLLDTNSLLSSDTIRTPVLTAIDTTPGEGQIQAASGSVDRDGALPPTD